MQTKHGEFVLNDGIKFMQSLPAGSVDLVASDVPYKAIWGGNKNPKAPKGMLTANDGNAGMKHNKVKAEQYFPEMYRLLKKGGDCFIFTNDMNVERVLREARRAGFGFHTFVMWRKNTKNPSRYYMQQCEYVLYFYKSPARTIDKPGTSQFLDDCDFTPVIDVDNPKKKKHPTEKPVDVMKCLIENSTHYGQTVLDPFAGSGATLIAAIESGRRFIGCELDPVHYYKTCGRIIISEVG